MRNQILFTEVAAKSLALSRLAPASASLRISIRQMPEGDAKSTVLKEFDVKFIEFAKAVGSREKALALLQTALTSSGANKTFSEEREKKRRKEKESQMLITWTNFKELPRFTCSSIK